jgi:molybdopterin converting factor subunit 1
MRVTVQVFARLRELAGRAEWQCEVQPGASVADVWRHVTASHPALSAFTASISCARNDDFAKMNATVHEGDVIAFLPPVSGG